MTPESVLNFYLTHRPISSRAALETWRPTVIQMIKEKVTCKAAHAWMEANQDKLRVPIPAMTTLRDWMGKVRSEEKERLKSEAELNATEAKGEQTGITTKVKPTRGPATLPVDPTPVPDGPEDAASCQHPDLFRLPIADVPAEAASLSEGKFRELILPQFQVRNEMMQTVRKHYRSLRADQRSDLAQAAFANLDSTNEMEFISRYADIYSILRMENATVETWMQGLFRGMQALNDEKVGR